MSRATELNEKLTQYQNTEGVLRVSHETEQRLKPAAYRIGNAMSEIFFREATQVNDTTLAETDARLDPITEEASSFWDLQAKYEALGLLHKRGILLESKPGTG